MSDTHKPSSLQLTLDYIIRSPPCLAPKVHTNPRLPSY